MIGLIIFGAQYLIFIIALIAAVHIFLNKERRIKLGILTLLALAIGYALARLAGLLYLHHQPFAVEGFEPLVPHAVDNAFPSDHTLISGVFASVAFLADRRIGLVLWALALLVGLARMFAGLHWGSDVLAAAVLALSAVFLAHKVVLWVEGRQP